MMKPIGSASNALFKMWKSLLASKGIREEGLFLLSGEKLVREFLENPSFEISAELVPAGGEPLTRAAFELATPLFKEIDVVGTGSNILVLKAPALEHFDLEKRPQGLELVVPVGDPLNLGAIARSALAFGASRLLLTEEAANPFLPKAIKASAGALLRLPIARIGKLRDYDAAGPSFALDLNGRDITTFEWPKNLRLLVGEEGPGLGSLAGVETLSIPTGPVESLNAAVAASLALDSYRRFNTRKT